MDLSMTACEKYDIFNMTGEIRVNILPRISPELSNYIATNPQRDLILDLAAVDFIDSSTIRLFVNLHKRMEANKRRLYLLKPSSSVKKILCDVKLDNVLSLVGDPYDLEKSISSTVFESYLPCTIKENDLRRLRCTCPVCGSKNVRGYLIDADSYDWKWEGDNAFPSAYPKTSSTPLDVAGLLPIVCDNCLLCSINIADFHACGETMEVFRSSIGEGAIQALLKSAKAREKMMDLDVVIGDNFFLHPRQKIACYALYLLAESCARSMAAAKTSLSSFWIGFHNYSAVKYAPPDHKDNLVNTSRTWMSQVLNEKAKYNACHLSRAYFIMLISALYFEKTKEAAKIHSEHVSLMETLPRHVQDQSRGIDSPAFWFSQAKTISEQASKGRQEAFKF